MTIYPNGIDSILQLPTVAGVSDEAIAINALREAVIAVETELGLTPSSVYSDVATRLSILESRVGPGAEITGGSIDINSANLTGVLTIAKGGTGLNSAGALHTVLTSTGSTNFYKLLDNNNIDVAAAIDGTKINPDFGSQNILTDGYVRINGATITVGAGAPASSQSDGSIYLRTDGSSSTGIYTRQSGAWSALGGGAGLSVSGTGFVHVTSGSVDAAAKLVVDADVNSSAAISLSKLSAGEKTCTLEQFGAVGDGVTNDQAAFEAARAALAAGTYNVLLLGAKTYVITGCDATHVWPMGVEVRGCGWASCLKTTTNGQVFLIFDTNATNRAKETKFADFCILGNSTGANQNGIESGYFGSDGTSRLRINNVTAFNMGGRGFSWAYGQSTGDGPKLTNCATYSCATGFFAGDQSDLVGCQAYQCTVGIQVNTGNVTWTDGCIASCTTGIQIDAGGNDSHGAFTGAKINHNTTAITCGAIANGHSFVGCHIYQGDIVVTGPNLGALVFDACRMDITTYTFTTASIRFQGCQFDTSYFSAYNESGNCEVFFDDQCRDINGTVPSFVANRTQVQFTFGADADDVLTTQESAATILEVQDGVITTTRAITSARAPERGKWIFVYNRNSQSITFKWSSGTGVTITSGKGALVGTDGTNAVKLLDGEVGSGGGTPGGLDTQVQFNDGGSFGGDAGLTYNKTTNLLSLTDAIAIGTTVASAGNIRLANTFNISRRNGGDSADETIMACTSDTLSLAGPASGTTGQLFSNLTLNAFSQANVNINGVAKAIWDANGMSVPNLTVTSTNLTLNSGIIMNFGSSSMPTTGLIRFPYNGGSAVSIIGVKDSTTTDRTFIQYGAGDAWTIGNTSQDLNLSSSNLTLSTANAVSSSWNTYTALQGTGDTLYLGTTSGYTSQANYIRIYSGGGGILGQATVNYLGWGTLAGGTFIGIFQNTKSYIASGKLVIDTTIDGSLQTTDATANQVLKSWSTTSNRYYAVRAIVTVLNSDASIYGEYEVKAGYTNSGGTLTQRHKTITEVVESDAGLTVDVNESGTAFRIVVTGLAATTLQWTCQEMIQEAAP